MEKINHWGKIRLKSFNNKAEECRKSVTEYLKRNLLKLTDELDKPKDILINKDALLQSVYEISVDLPNGTGPITISNDMKIDTDENASSSSGKCPLYPMTSLYVVLVQFCPFVFVMIRSLDYAYVNFEQPACAKRALDTMYFMVVHYVSCSLNVILIYINQVVVW
ncbi:unnamed protein product [Adineta ricciae]|uniref:Uncharacterized protein n=1 Tax=Adineta ricciae TaxID=249248 RepID=A0A815NTM3_ADIRI|nr:unnamed protein product [Adineta ricciae]